MTITYAGPQARRATYGDYDETPDPEKITETIAAMRSYLDDLQNSGVVTRSEGRDILTAWKSDYLLRLLRHRE